MTTVQCMERRHADCADSKLETALSRACVGWDRCACDCHVVTLPARRDQEA